MRTSIRPPLANVSRTSEKLAPVNTRFLNSEMGIIGESIRVSQIPKPTSASTLTTAAASVPGCVMPSFGHSLIVHTSAVIPTTDSTVPTGSGLRHGPLDSGISTSAETIASRAIGMLMRKTAPHQKWAMSTPPNTGPPTRPIMATALHAPIALGRSSSSKTVMRIDSVLGINRAPPMPISTRAKISISALPAQVASTEAAPKTARPMIMTLRRPYRSDRLPAVSSRPAKTSMYDSRIHWMSWALASRSSAIGGTATVRTMLSMTSTSVLRHNTIRISQRRG